MLSGGDARKSLNLLEMFVDVTEDPVVLEDEAMMAVAQERVAQYDKDGEQHYDIISAFIKSIRGSDANAAIYWLARMLAGGADRRDHAGLVHDERKACENLRRHLCLLHGPHIHPAR